MDGHGADGGDKRTDGGVVVLGQVGEVRAVQREQGLVGGDEALPLAERGLRDAAPAPAPVNYGDPQRRDGIPPGGWTAHVRAMP